MRATVYAISLLCLAGCVSNESLRQTAANIEAEAEAVANEFEAQMTPDERAEMNDRIAENVMAEMQRVAKRCGTSLVFIGKPNPGDWRVKVAPATTSEQLACVRNTYGFVEDHG